VTTLPRPCGATRPSLCDPGWECTGRDLIIVMTTRALVGAVPVVMPARALEIHQPEDWWDAPVRPFTGGDHLHLCVPRRPLPAGFRPNSSLITGGEMQRVRLAGIDEGDPWVAMEPPGTDIRLRPAQQDGRPEEGS
jgi:hypothetical protein